MSSILQLARAEIRALQAYHSASSETDLIRLHANEAPWRAPGDDSPKGLNRYPDPRPDTLRRRFARLYGVEPARVLATRGSDDAIDVLIRTFCEAGRDEIVICPPTFDMYRIWAQIQGAGIVECPLDASDGFRLPVRDLIDTWRPAIKLVFLCSPNNPTGNSIPVEDVRIVCEALQGKALVVVDQAYADFSRGDRLTPLLERFNNLVLLRTVSKAYALAALRLGVILADPELIELTSRVVPPYPLPTPTIEAALRALAEEEQARLAEHIQELLEERSRIESTIVHYDCIEKVWPSDANFLLIRAVNPQAVVESCRANGVLIRDFSSLPHLTNCLRITIGSRAQNDQLLAGLERA